MKKLLTAILSAAMLCTTAFAFTGCGGESSQGTGAQETTEGAAVISSIDDLPGKTIGVQLGTTGDIYASDYEKEGSKIERFNKGADAVLALSQGKIDCVIIDNEPAKAFVAANKGLKILEEPFAEEEYAICVAKDNEKLTSDINKVLKELKDEGTVDKIINNYIGDDAGNSPYESPADVDTSKGELHMATNAFFEPYEYYDGDAVVGIDAMMAQAICDKLGYKLVIDNMDFDSIITAVQTGKADFGMAGMTVTEERLQSINFTDTYTTATQVIIVKE